MNHCWKYGFIFCLFFSFAMLSQWKQANGPYGGSTISFTVDTTNGNLYAGTTDNGIFKSTDNGDFWTAVNNGLTNKRIRALAVKESNVFAATNGGIFKSNDNGKTWVEVNNGLTKTPVYSLIVKNNIIFAGTSSGRVFKSANDGQKWTDTSSLRHLNLWV